MWVGAGVGARVGTVFAVWVGAPGVRAGLMHAAVALVAVAVARGWTAEEEEHEQDDRQDLPACGRERERGLVRIWFQFCVFFSISPAHRVNSRLTKRLPWRRAGGASARRTRFRAENARSDPILKYERRTERAAHLCGRPGGGRARGGRAALAAAREGSPAPARGPRAPAERRAWSRARTPQSPRARSLEEGPWLGSFGGVTLARAP